MRIDELERELRAERPEAAPDFCSRLDDWAASGFPSDSGLGPRALGAGATAGPGRLGRLRRRLPNLSPRRVLLPLGAAATVLVVVGVAISQQGGSDLSSSSGRESAPSGAGARAGGLEDASAGDSGSAASGAAAPEASAPQDTDLAPLQEAPQAAPPSDSIARGAGERIIDATARIRLGAGRGEVQEVANGVVAATDRFNGVVRDSEVTTDMGGARAAFELEIPYRELDPALTAISELGDVISRTQSAEDITAQAVRSQRQLARVLEQISAARIERIDVDTHEERLIIDARIDSLEATAGALRSEIDGVKRQGRFATVDVEITSEGPDAGSGGAWSISDALDDAGRALEVIAGVALVTLAIAVPLALVGLLAWLIAVRARRLSRERALDA